MIDLKKMRMAKGLTQEGLARAVGIGKSTLQCYELGTLKLNHASGVTLLKLAKILECDVETLIKEE